ncbi:MAG: cell division ATP-binding protein FtsE [Oscillospiraceae bacterium]|nr:cell division ATP-binding protein FtsE [Eubacteriales bacterium]MDY2618696.1 cell division ATP-binding protein FtsE [Oscillospiraceae bacterium]
MIRFNNVRKTYPNGTQALKGLSFELKDGEFAFLVGPSGAGKSTILSLLTAEEPISGGSLMVNGYNLNTIRPGQVPYLRRSLGIVFQDFRLIPKKTVYENMAFAMRVVGASPREMRRRIPYVLDLVGLTGKENNMPDELSGGEQQRVAIARALVNNPSTIIADEPTGNLDPDRSMEIMSLLERINALGTTMLVVTHEKGLVNHFNKRVIHIEDGVVASDEEDGFYIYGDDNKETDAETAEAQEQ